MRKRTKKFDRIFNDALERVLQGEDLENCLQDYSDEAEELRPLLKLALQLKHYNDGIKPSPEFKSRTQANLEEAFWARQRSWKTRVSKRLKPVIRWAAVTTGVVILLVSAFIGGFALSSLASADTMPGETLYPVKLATEEVRIALVFSDVEKVELLTQSAETRAEEIAYAAEKGDSAQIEAGVERLEGSLRKIEGICARVDQANTSVVIAGEKSPESQLQKMEHIIKNSSIRAIAKLEKASEYDSRTMEQVIPRVKESYTKALEADRISKE
jgi:hypothetical protein